MTNEHRQRTKPRPRPPKPPKAGSLLDQAIKATKQTEPDRAKDLVDALTDEALKGTITCEQGRHPDDQRPASQAIDAAISKQLAADHARAGVPASWKGPGAA